MKIVIALALVGIILALGSAGVFMLRRKPQSQDEEHRAADAHMARALAVRVGISVALFLFILLGWAMGWLRPTGLPVGV
jgi:uncharacterized iron-regulated membrane protein